MSQEQFSTRHFVVADPRSFEGNPYEAAARAAGQVEALLMLAAEQLPAVRIMVRNAELERQLANNDSPDPIAWEQGVYGRRFDAAVEEVERLRKEFATQAKAAGFNPKGKI